MSEKSIKTPVTSDNALQLIFIHNDDTKIVQKL